MNRFSPATDADIDRAREDPVFRHKLLQQSLDMLLSRLQKQHQTTRSGADSASQIREGVTLAVRLAELIQNSTDAAARTR
jgi:hypothetical protein